MLLRAFAICACWSPFFATMGLTLVSAPGAQMKTLALYTIPMSILGLVLTSWAIKKSPDADALQGYPMKLQTLWMPVLLAVVILLAHSFRPDINVLTIVSVTALSFSTGWLLINHGRYFYLDLIQHVENGISNSKGEVVIFSAAAMLAAGVASFTTSLDLQLAPAHFGSFEACATLTLLVVLAMAGMHPVTSVALAGGLLAPSVSDPNILALTLLMGWSIGITLSPLSGVQLSIQSRYRIKARDILRLNTRYGGIMMLGAYLTLYLYVYL